MDTMYNYAKYCPVMRQKWKLGVINQGGSGLQNPPGLTPAFHSPQASQWVGGYPEHLTGNHGLCPSNTARFPVDSPKQSKDIKYRAFMSIFP